MQTPSLRFGPGQTLLFQGDSITDAGRDRKHPDGEAGLGQGYAMMAASRLQVRFPELRLRVHNRGVSGDRVPNLLQRWQPDCLALKPDWVSVLIGINDVWRAFDANDPTSTQAYARGYRELLERTREGTEARLILCEPFVLPHPPDRLTWRADLDPKLQVVRELAREFEAILVPFDGVFAAACARREPAFWAHDGVHPTPAGHMLMAEHWLQAVGGL
ncbi:MAG: SGNH/GDSL hydrolase family protein [Opitutales bacterium]